MTTRRRHAPAPSRHHAPAPLKLPPSPSATPASAPDPHRRHAPSQRHATAPLLLGVALLVASGAIAQATHVANDAVPRASGADFFLLDKQRLSASLATKATPKDNDHKLDGAGQVLRNARTGSARQCETLYSMRCEKAIGYNLTELPNVWGHQAKQERDEDVELYDVLMRSDCSKEIKPFLCATFYPQCDPLAFGPIYPCRDLCVRVRRACRPFLRQLEFDWPAPLHCKNFPHRAHHQPNPKGRVSPRDHQSDDEFEEDPEEMSAPPRCTSAFPSTSRYPRVPNEDEISTFGGSHYGSSGAIGMEEGSGKKEKRRRKKQKKSRPHRSTKKPLTVDAAAAAAAAYTSTTRPDRIQQLSEHFMSQIPNEDQDRIDQTRGKGKRTGPADSEPPVYKPDDIPLAISREDFDEVASFSDLPHDTGRDSSRDSSHETERDSHVTSKSVPDADVTSFSQKPDESATDWETKTEDVYLEEDQDKKPTGDETKDKKSLEDFFDFDPYDEGGEKSTRPPFLEGISANTFEYIDDEDYTIEDSGPTFAYKGFPFYDQSQGDEPNPSLPNSYDSSYEFKSFPSSSFGSPLGPAPDYHPSKPRYSRVRPERETNFGGLPFLVFLALVCAGAILLVIALSCIILYNVDASVQKQLKRKMHRIRSQRL